MIRKVFILTTLPLATLPLSAAAELQPAVAELMHYMDITETCLDAAPDPDAAAQCVSQGATLCKDGEQGGYSTVGVMFCNLAEYEAWDRLLNREYGLAMSHLEALDTEEAEFFPEYAIRTDKLRDAQRAWIPFRDAQCSMEYAMWGSGSIRQIAGSSCLIEESAKRTIYLRFLGERMQ